MVSRVDFEEVVLDRSGFQLQDVFIERTAQGDIENLMPATDSQQGLLPGHCLASQKQFNPIAVAINILDVARMLAAIVFPVNVSAARQYQSVQLLEQRTQGSLVQPKRNQHRDAARSSNCVDVGRHEGHEWNRIRLCGRLSVSR